MILNFESFSLFLIATLIGNLLSQKFSGKHEGDQSRMKSIIIPLRHGKVFWLHHWLYYLISGILLIFAYLQIDLFFKIVLWLISPILMLTLLYFSKLINSKSHLLILILISFISFLSLFNFYLLIFVIGAFVGMILHGLSYKDRFDFIVKKPLSSK